MSINLIDLGLPDRESRAYQALLKEGPLSPTQLARAIGTQRPNVYEITRSIEEKGLVHYVFHGKRKLFAAEPPSKLEDLAKEKLVIARNAIPLLTDLMSDSTFRSKVTFYEGKKAVQSLFKDALSSGVKEIWYLWSPQDMNKILDKKLIERFISERIKKDIAIRSLRPAEKESLYRFESDTTTGRELTAVGYVPEKYTFSLSLALYGNKVAFFSSQKESFGFLVESREMSQMMRMFYEVLWANSGKLRG